MPKKIHDKVDDLLNSPSFYPEKSEKEREELAWPIATNIVKESSFNLKRFTYAQAEDLLKSNGIQDFVAKFEKFAAGYPNLNSIIVFADYIKREAQYNNQKLTKYPAFTKLLNFLRLKNSVVPSAEIQKFLTDTETANKDDFNPTNETTETEQQTTDSNTVDLTKQQAPDKQGVLSQLPGAEKSSIPGVTGLQNVIQYTSQSAANAPKNQEQIDASERMFMMDNMNALRILSRNIYDVNALRNFEKDLTFSKNHIGTRFQGPVNNLLGKYGELASTPDSDRKTKNKLGAEIQYIIQNQLLGSGVRPSVIFNSLQNPNSRTDYLYSGSKPPTPYQFRYVEDVYFDMKNELTTKFNEDRKAFAEQYIKDNPDIAKDFTADNLPENFYPDELKQIAKPGSPIHQRAWMEQNQKGVLQKAFGAEQAENDNDTPVGQLIPGPALKTELKAPQAPDPRNFDKSDLSGMVGKPKIDTNNISGILGRPPITNPNPTKPSAFNLKNSTPPTTPPPTS
jgi:hypothetical protein